MTLYIIFASYLQFLYRLFYMFTAQLHALYCVIVRFIFCSPIDMFKVGHCLTKETGEMMDYDFMATLLDYCNALLYGLPKT